MRIPVFSKWLDGIKSAAHDLGYAEGMKRGREIAERPVMLSGGPNDGRVVDVGTPSVTFPILAPGGFGQAKYQRTDARAEASCDVPVYRYVEPKGAKNEVS